MSEPQATPLYRRFLQNIEVDRAVAFGILTVIWRMIAFPVTAVLISYRFTPELQGYYYTFNNLLALQVFVELGLGTVIIQFASHEWSKLHLAENGQIAGDKEALSRLISLAKLALKWYLTGGIMLTLGLGIGGYLFFSQSNTGVVDWRAPWFALCVFTGINIYLLPLWSLLEGCNQVAEVYLYRFIHGLCTNMSIWLAILLDAKLWTAVACSAIGLVCAVFFISKYYWPFFNSLLVSHGNGPKVSWHAEIWPMQWRIALSWLSGYFVFSFFTPVLFQYHGPIIAGQMGMTWAVITVLSSTSSAWLSPKAPHFGMLIVQKKYNELDHLFRRLLAIVIGIAGIGAVAIWSVVYALYRFDHPLSARLLPPLPTSLFLLATVIMVATFPFSTYLRAHKKEPLFLLSVTAGILIGLSTLIFGERYAAIGMAAGYLLVNLFLLPCVLIIWYRCRREWQKNA